MKNKLVTSPLKRYLLTDENFIFGGKKLFKNIIHIAQYALRVKNISPSHSKYKKLLHAEFSRIARAIESKPLSCKVVIAEFRDYLWGIVRVRSKDICPHKEICTTCPLATSCRNNFDAHFDLLYPN